MSTSLTYCGESNVDHRKPSSNHFSWRGKKGWTYDKKAFHPKPRHKKKKKKKKKKRKKKTNQKKKKKKTSAPPRLRGRIFSLLGNPSASRQI